MTSLVNSREAAIKILTGLRVRLVDLQKSVTRKRRLRPSERAMWVGAYQQEIEALTLAIMALEKEPTEEHGNGHTATS